MLFFQGKLIHHIRLCSGSRNYGLLFVGDNRFGGEFAFPTGEGF